MALFTSAPIAVAPGQRVTTFFHVLNYSFQGPASAIPSSVRFTNQFGDTGPSPGWFRVIDEGIDLRAGNPLLYVYTFTIEAAASNPLVARCRLMIVWHPNQP